jgi:hypothetical protein
MSLETRAHRAAEWLRTATDVEVDVDAGLARLRRTHRLRNTTRVAGAALAVACVVGGGALVLDGTDGTARPADRGPVDGPASRSISESPSTSPLRTGSWQDYTSARYDFTVGHPPGWTEEPANRDWVWEEDVADHLSPAHEAFLSPNGHVRLSVWNAPLDAGTRQESIPYLLEWAANYCEESGNSPCTGIADRAVELCVEKWDCHPGLLVPFENDVQAFFSGGIYAQDAMTVVAVWRGESSRFVARYGGSQRLLEAFLSTMEVWPSSTPTHQRR